MNVHQIFLWKLLNEQGKEMREGNGGSMIASSTQLGAFDLCFGSYSTLPFNTIWSLLYEQQH